MRLCMINVRVIKIAALRSTGLDDADEAMSTKTNIGEILVGNSSV